MSDGVLVFDFNGRLTFSNPAGRALLRLQDEEISGKGYIDLFMGEPENDAFNDILFSGIQDRETHVHREVPFRCVDGNLLDLSVATSFLRAGEGKEEGIVVVFKDITESKALDRARQRVIDHLSHELKTPLAIIGATLKRVDGPETSKFVERIEHNLKRLQEIQVEVEDIVREVLREDEGAGRSLLEQMSDLLEIVAERREVYKEPVRLLKEELRDLFDIGDSYPRILEMGPSVEEAVESVRASASHRQVLVRTIIDSNPKILIGPDTMRKALAALLKNAMEATPDGGEILVSLRVLDGGAVVEVRDTGVGITEESQRQIFGGFYHAKETDLYTTRKPFDFGAGGKGLDLLRMKILAKTYNFGIECESTRCRFIPYESDLCPGSIEGCSHVQSPEECARAGGTTFRVIFPRC
jgi:PAS domain S-box-containing protein